MKKQLKLSVPTPCHENWNSFAPRPDGRFCSSCAKTVLDFSEKTDEQILSFLKNKPDDTCGRFRPDQLKTYVTPKTSPAPIFNSHWRLFKAGIVGMFLLFSGKQVSAQVNPVKKTEQVVTSIGIDHSAHEKAAQTSGLTVRGKILDDTGLGLPGTSIIVKGRNKGAVTDFDGNYELTDMNAGDVVIISFIGYETVEYTVEANHSDNALVTLDIDMELSTEYLCITGSLAVEEVYQSDKKGWFSFLSKK